MSDKPKRNIEIGELQDECKRVLGCCIDGGCRVRSVCPTYLHLAPDAIDLTDPPRFNEAQMALLKALYGIGIKKITRDGKASFHATRDEDAGDKFLGVIEMGENEALDLAELLGKDGAE